jgi:DNA-binding response OmpR family regulator
MGSLVLVVDDSAQARELTRTIFEREGFEVAEAADGLSALAAVESVKPDLMLLDLGMAGVSGLEVLTQLRRKSTLPVIVVTGRTEESERVLALELGADDYVVKPFLVRELPARVRSVLRRTAPATAQEALAFGDLVIRLAEREVVVANRVVETTPREFDVLAKLASAPRKVFSRQELLRDVWGSSSDWQDVATVTEHVRRLRQKIEPDPSHPRWIQSVRGVGYRFEPPASPA